MADVEATKIIPDLDSSLVDYVRTKLNPRCEKRKPDEVYRGAEVHFLVNNQVGYVCLYDRSENSIVYFVRYKEVKQTGLKAGRQVLLWKDRSHIATTEFADHVFFLYLLPRFRTLFADVLQTEKGREFWQYALSKAFRIGLNVYMLDRRSIPTPVKLESFDDVVKHYKDLWGPTNAHEYTWAVISKDKLQIKGT